MIIKGVQHGYKPVDLIGTVYRLWDEFDNVPGEDPKEKPSICNSIPISKFFDSIIEKRKSMRMYQFRT